MWVIGSYWIIGWFLLRVDDYMVIYIVIDYYGV